MCSNGLPAVTTMGVLLPCRKLVDCCRVEWMSGYMSTVLSGRQKFMKSAPVCSAVSTLPSAGVCDW